MTRRTEQHRLCASHLTSGGSFSGFGDGWTERLCHICKVNSPMPSALATLPLTMLVIFSQKWPVCLDRKLCWGGAGSLVARQLSLQLPVFLEGCVCPSVPHAPPRPPQAAREAKCWGGVEDQGSEGPPYEASLQLRKGAL